MVNQEQILLNQCGDHFSQREKIHALYREHSGWLNSWLCRKLRCPDNASELAQDTFVRVANLLELKSCDLLNRHRCTFARIDHWVMPYTVESLIADTLMV